MALLAASGFAGCERAKPQPQPQPQPQPPGPQPSPTRMVGDAATSDAAPSLPDAGRVATHADAAPSDAAPQDLGPEPKEPPPPPTVKKQNKGDCQLAYAPRPTRDPNPVCKIAGGTFMMGSAEPDAAPDEKPVRKVTLTPYFIDQFEVTNAQVVHFLNTVGNQCAIAPECLFAVIGDANLLSGSLLFQRDGRYSVQRGKEHHPVKVATVEGAERYCAWVGKRLPTEAEWEFAARHDPKTNQDYRWPWGDTFLPKRAACEENDCKDGFFDDLKRPGSADQAPVGTFDGTHGFGDGSSPWGVHDMAGNVSELMADAYSKPYAGCACDGKACDPCVDPFVPVSKGTTLRTLRSIHSEAMYLSTHQRVRTNNRINGFRCAYR